MLPAGNRSARKTARYGAPAVGPTQGADLRRGKVRDVNGRYYDATAFFTMPNMGCPAMGATGECGCGIGYCRRRGGPCPVGAAAAAPEVGAYGPGGRERAWPNAAGDRAQADQRAATDRPAGPAGSVRRMGRQRPELGQSGQGRPPRRLRPVAGAVAAPPIPDLPGGRRPSLLRSRTVYRLLRDRLTAAVAGALSGPWWRACRWYTQARRKSRFVRKADSTSM